MRQDKKLFGVRCFVILFVLVVTIFTGCGDSSSRSTDSEKIKIASFNIQDFGVTKMGRVNTFETLAKIVANFDLCAIQELSNSTGTVIAAFLNKINEISPHTYACVWQVSGDEQYAYIYRTDKVKVVGTPYVYSGSQSFSRPPYVAYFQTVSGNFDFIMVTTHVAPAATGPEITALQSVVSDAKVHFGDNDVLCVGDYNSDGSYFIEGSGEALPGWSTSQYLTIIPNSADTTVAASAYTYDRMQMTISGQEDFTGNWGVFIFKDHYDVTICEGSSTRDGTEAALSDHYPVWAEFYIDRDTD